MNYLTPEVLDQHTGDYCIQPNLELNLYIAAHLNSWDHKYGTLYLQISRIATTLISSNLDLRQIYLVYHNNELSFLLP